MRGGKKSDPSSRLRHILKEELEAGKLYHPIEHPDFNLPVRGAKRITPQEERLKAILNFYGGMYKVKGRTVLDVGCCLGYFCFKLARMGAYVVGIDISEKWIQACKCLAQLYGAIGNPLFVQEDIVEYLDKVSAKFDIALNLSVFHHLLGRDEASAWKCLNQLSKRAEVMFLTMGDVCTQEEIPSIILNHSTYTQHKKLLVDSSRKRSLYAFWR